MNDNKVWKLLCPEFKQNIYGFRQRFKLAVYQDSQKPIEGDVIEVIEKSAYDQLKAENEKLKSELEFERMRLAACSVAALANTEGSKKYRIDKSNPYWSASYGDVCDAVDREMAALVRVKELERALEACKEQRDAF